MKPPYKWDIPKITLAKKKDMETQKTKDFGCHIFKLENVVDTFISIDNAISIISKLEKLLNKSFQVIDGLSIVELWSDIKNDIFKLWNLDPNSPLITLNSIQENKLLIVAECTVTFALNNGFDSEDPLFKNIDAMFNDVKLHSKNKPLEERLNQLKKDITEII